MSLRSEGTKDSPSWTGQTNGRGASDEYGAIVWEGEILPSIPMGQEVPPLCLQGSQNKTAPFLPPLHSSPPKARLNPHLLPETLQSPALPNGHRQPGDGSPCTWACCWEFTLGK